MKLLLLLYPSWWRRRYGAEALDILQCRPITASLLWAFVVGALDAWLYQEMPPSGAPKQNNRVASVVAGLCVMLLVGAIVFVETGRTTQGHADGAARPFDPLVVFAIATAGVGFWVLLTGRRLGNWPIWPFQGRALRFAAAYDVVGSLLVVALVVARNDGFAFLTYASLALTLSAITQVIRSRKGRYPGIPGI